MVMGTGLNWEDEWKQAKELVVEEFGRRMVTKEWLMGEV
jgi:hypothetical protein